jgi:hypothetical protein
MSSYLVSLTSNDWSFRQKAEGLDGLSSSLKKDIYPSKRIPGMNYAQSANFGLLSVLIHHRQKLHESLCPDPCLGPSFTILSELPHFAQAAVKSLFRRP